ncbi:MAG: class I SAM-dependent methyltransferase [Chloroflexia bacterium]|nr:class I SAM-dependent methyltransferase [Chloroflexia bacterium]
MYPRFLEKFDSLLVRAVNKYANFRWYSSPLTKKPKADKEHYFKLASEAKLKKYPIINNYEQKYNYSIDLDWMHELALHTQIVVKKSELNYQHGRLLYSSLRSYISKNIPAYVNIIETGTARGFSSLCMAKALEDANIHGKIITLDVLPHHHKMYWNCIDDLEGKKTRSQLLKNYHHLTEKYIVFHQGNSLTELQKIQMERIHFAFLDGSHNYYHLMKEFMEIFPRQNENDIVFLMTIVLNILV